MGEELDRFTKEPNSQAVLSEEKEKAKKGASTGERETDIFKFQYTTLWAYMFQIVRYVVISVEGMGISDFLIRYGLQVKTPYTMLSDSVNHFGFIWGHFTDWTYGKQSVISREYPLSEWAEGQVHKCKYIIGKNQPNKQMEKGPREILLTLIFAALEDKVAEMKKAGNNNKLVEGMANLRIKK
jgi:hypothetical protein